ncbi:MAG: peptidylprolyl isomerase [Bryobacteraceae bacterium]|nr:peptidylprolyl isomerase [Bryobacteraceae bacterium]
MRFLLPFAFAAALCAQPPQPQQPTITLSQYNPNDVVAVVDGRPFTAAELDALLNSFQGLRRNMMSNPDGFLQQYGFLIALTKIAEQKGLEKKTPVKERLEYSRIQILGNAQIDQQFMDIPLGEPELKAYYEKNKDNYSFVNIKAIYIPFSAAPPPQADPKAKKILTEAEALAKAQLVAKEARASGADFVELVKTYSDDPVSKTKDGDFGTFRRSDKNIPPDIGKVLFSMKTGDVSDPVKQPNGYYVFKAVEAANQSYEQALPTMATDARGALLQEWVEKTMKGVKVEIKNPSYFGKKDTPAPAAPAVPPAK